MEAQPVAGSFPGDAVLGYLDGVLAALGGLAHGTAPVDDAVRVDRISLLERIKAATAAAQAAEIVAFARGQVAGQRDAGVDYRRLGQGIAEQIGLATRTSGWHGARRLTLARDLVTQLPQTFVLLTAGEISEDVARRVATETSHLDPDIRRAVDEQLAAADVHGLAPKAAAGLARRLAQQADPSSAVKRARHARSERYVSVRPAPDTMCWFSALLPVEDGVRCYAALVRHADTAHAAGDERTRRQVMADTLTERLTGLAPADVRPVELNVTVPLEHLVNPTDQTSAEVTGWGPIPAGLADDLIRSAGGQVAWRRLFTAPTLDGQGRVVVGGDPTARRFTGGLARLLRLRDGGTCREPYCGAPIRHLDHIQPWREGGPTVLANGRGVCERHNYSRELPGWLVKVDQIGAAGQPEVIATTTPTGHTYLSRAPDPP